MTDKPRNYQRRKDKKVNDWTLKKEKLLRYWQEECKLYNWLYRQNVEWYQKTNRYMSISGILLSAITGTTLINQSGNTSSQSDEILFIVFGLMSITSTFIQGVKEFMDYNGKISSNTLSARQNSSIVIDIEEQLNLSRQERINGKEFMKNIKTRKNEIIQNGPMIPKSSWKKLRKSIHKKEGLNFFNQNLFQNYLDQNIDYTRIDFNLDNQSSGSSSSEHSSTISSPITLEIPKITHTKLHKTSPLNQNSNHQIIDKNIDKNNGTMETINRLDKEGNANTNANANANVDNDGNILQHLDTKLINSKTSISNDEVINYNNYQGNERNTNYDNTGNNSNYGYNDFQTGELDFVRGGMVRSNSLNTLPGSEDEFLEDMQNNNVSMYELRNKINVNDEEFNKRNTSGINLSNISNLLPSFLKGSKNVEEETQLEGIIIDGNYIKSHNSKVKSEFKTDKRIKLEEKRERKEQLKEAKKQKKIDDKKLKNQLKYHTSFI